MPSINDISIAINSLFLDITDPITLGLNKTNFFNAFTNTFFRHEPNIDFEFNANPVFRFDDSDSLKDFLKKELMLCERYVDFAHKNEIEEMLAECENSTTIDDLYLNYTVEISGEETIVCFDTNSLIFKYEVIG